MYLLCLTLDYFIIIKSKANEYIINPKERISSHIILNNIADLKVYLPCALIVVLSWVGFWLNREATSDRVTLGNTK